MPPPPPAAPPRDEREKPALRRVLTLWPLIFYGLGVIVGAGITGIYQLHIALWDERRAVVAGSYRLLHVFEVATRPWVGGPADVRPRVELVEPSER